MGGGTVFEGGGRIATGPEDWAATDISEIISLGILTGGPWEGTTDVIGIMLVGP